MDGASSTEIGYLSGASSNIQTQLNLKSPLANPTFTGTINAANLTLSGDLTINGTTTTLNSTTLTVDDKNIELGSVTSPTDITADGGGITLKGTTDKTLNWVDSTDSWTSSENIDLAANKKFTIASNPVMCPAGMLAPYAGSTAPDGWLLCAGQAVSRTTYAGLFSVISTIYGAGDNSTTFNIPDLRGRGAVGKDDMGGTAANRVTAGISGIAGITLGAFGGSENIHLHSHANTATFTGSAVTSGAGSAHQHANTLTNNAVNTGNDSPDHSHSGTTGAMNSNASHAHGFAQVDTSGVTAGSANRRVGTQGAGTVSDVVVAANIDHTHNFSTGGRSAFHQHSVTSNVTISNVNESAHTHSVTAAGTVAVTNANFGSGTSQNMQPSIILNYIIKY